MRWDDYSGLPGWAQNNHKGPYKEVREIGKSDRERDVKDRSRSWGDVIACLDIGLENERGPLATECSWPLEAKKITTKGFSLKTYRSNIALLDL